MAAELGRPIAGFQGIPLDASHRAAETRLNSPDVAAHDRNEVSLVIEGRYESRAYESGAAGHQNVGHMVFVALRYVLCRAVTGFLCRVVDGRRKSI